MPPAAAPSPPKNMDLNESASLAPGQYGFEEVGFASTLGAADATRAATTGAAAFVTDACDFR